MSKRHQTPSYYRQAEKGLNDLDLSHVHIADRIAFLQVKATLALVDAINDSNAPGIVSTEPLAPAEPMKLEDIALTCAHGYAICVRCDLVPESWRPQQ